MWSPSLGRGKTSLVDFLIFSLNPSVCLWFLLFVLQVLDELIFHWHGFFLCRKLLLPSKLLMDFISQGILALKKNAFFNDQFNRGSGDYRVTAYISSSYLAFSLLWRLPISEIIHLPVPQKIEVSHFELSRQL